MFIVPRGQEKMKKALFIYNPVSGRKQLRFVFEKIINILNKEYDVVIRETNKAGDGTEIVREGKINHYDAIICCGGDGTLNEVVNGILECELSIPLGYIPCGSTNDFAKSLRVPTNPIAAANNIVKSGARLLDIGLFNNTRHFSYIASFGAFTAASYDTPQNMKNILGHLAYVIRGTKDFFELKNSPEYNVEITPSGADPFCGKYFFGAVCNSTSVGGVVRLPESSVDFGDGMFEAIFVRKPQSNKEWFSLLDDIVHKNIESNPLVDICKTESLTVKIKERPIWTLDGEKMPADEIVTVSNKKHAVSLFI